MFERQHDNTNELEHHQSQLNVRRAAMHSTHVRKQMAFQRQHHHHCCCRSLLNGQCCAHTYQIYAHDVSCRLTHSRSHPGTASESQVVDTQTRCRLAYEVMTASARSNPTESNPVAVVDVALWKTILRVQFCHRAPVASVYF